MNKNFNKVYTYLVIFVSSAFILFFQNCTQPIQYTDSDFSSLNSKDDFLYESKVDTISHLSCSKMTNGSILSGGQRFTFIDAGYYTFKFGGYGTNGGVRFSNKTMSRTQYLNETDMANFLKKEDYAISYLQLILRENYDLTKEIGSYSENHWFNGSAFLKGIQKGLSGDKYLISSLADEGIQTQMVSDIFSNNRLNRWHQSFRFGGSDFRNVEASLFLGDLSESGNLGESSLTQVRSALSSLNYQTHLTVNFSTEMESVEALTFKEANKYQAIGQSFRFTFTGRNITQVFERDLSTGTVNDLQDQYSSSSWNCPETLKLKVYPFEATVGEKEYRASDVPNLLNEPTIEYLQNYLGEDEAKRVSALLIGDWYVNLSPAILVAVKKPQTGTSFDEKGNLCYSQDKINEYANKDSFPWEVEADRHYLSICLRN